MSKKMWAAPLAAILAVSAWAADPKVDALIEGMKTGADARLVEARQHMPYLDPVAASEALTGLLGHENERVWRTAYNLLADFANITSVPGREAQREAVSAALMSLLAVKRSQHEKEQALRLLPQVLPEDYNLAPILVLLRGNDAHLRERARAALWETGTRSAATALRAGLPDAEPAFQAAILDALAQMGAAAEAAELVRYLDSASPEVQVAAARVLAQTGQVEYLAGLRALRTTLSGACQDEAFRALLALLNQMAARGGNWDLAIDTMTTLLDEIQAPALRGAILVSLGRHGTAAQVPLIIGTAASSEDLALAGAAIRALEYRNDRATREALLAAYPGAPEGMKPALLALFGRKQDPAYLELMTREAQHSDAAVREAACEALSLSGRAEAVAPLVAVLEAAENKGQARAHLARLAQALRLQQSPQAGHAFVALYRAAEDADARRDALQGILQFPVPEAYDIVADAVGKEELAAFPPAALGGISHSLREAGREAEAREVFELLFARLDSPEAVQQVVALAPQWGRAEEVSQRLGFLRAWHIVGPFPWKMADGFSAEGINAREPALETPLTLSETSAAWKAVRTEDAMGIVNLMSELGPHEQARAYAFTTVEVPEAMDAVLYLGSDDGIAVWVNGEQVFENNVDRGLALDQDRAPVRLQAGRNAVLVQISQGGGGWMFCARITRADGSRL